MQHFRAAFERIAEQVIVCDSAAPGTPAFLFAARRPGRVLSASVGRSFSG